MVHHNHSALAASWTTTHSLCASMIAVLPVRTGLPIWNVGVSIPLQPIASHTSQGILTTVSLGSYTKCRYQYLCTLVIYLALFRAQSLITATWYPCTSVSEATISSPEPGREQRDEKYSLSHTTNSMTLQHCKQHGMVTGVKLAFVPGCLTWEGLGTRLVTSFVVSCCETPKMTWKN